MRHTGVVARLVDDGRLERCSVVANSAMNRDRGLGGRDGYVRNLGIDPVAVLGDRLAGGSGAARWVDLCCGSGRALLEAAGRLPGRAEITGVDLVDFFAGPPAGRVRFVTASVGAWRPDEACDLITSVHGLHYVGDKLGVLCAAASWLSDDGVLVANFDVGAIRLPGGKSARRRLTAALREAGFAMDPRRRRIRRDGRASVRLPFRYLGADPSAGPNYTGQPAVHSYYEPAQPQ